MNPIGIYYAYWTHEWDVDFVPYIARAKRLGFDILEINAGTVANMKPQELATLRGAAKDTGIELTFCVGLPHAYDIASPDAAVRAAGIDYLQRMVRGIAELDGRILGGIIYSSWPGKLPAGVDDRRPFIDRSVQSMRDVAKLAEDRDVALCVEVVNRFEQYTMNTAAEAVAYVDRVGSPACKVLLDSFHLNIEEDDIAAAIRTAGDKLGHFHIGETNRRAPGRGRMAWDAIFPTLQEINYRGAISMEPFLMPGGQVGRDISVYRDLRDGLDLDEEARRALGFVRSRLSN